MIHYNNPKASRQRAESKPPSKDEMKEAVNSLNQNINWDNITDKEERLIQRMIWNYENMEYFIAINEGAYCTHHPEIMQDPERVFQIRFKRGS